MLVNNVLKLLGITKESKQPGSKIQVVSTVFPTREGQWRLSVKSFDSDVEQPTTSVGWNMGLRPTFVRVSVTGGWDYESIIKLFPKSFTNADIAQLIRLSKTGYATFDISVLKDPNLIAAFLRNAAMMVGLKVSDEEILPAHPGWIQPEDRSFHLCLRSPGSMSFDKVASALKLDIKTIVQRAGKDLWTTGYNLPEMIKLLVIPKQKGHDGSFYVKQNSVEEACPRIGLVRGLAAGADGFALRPGVFIKGRIIVSDCLANILPDGSALPEGYDGWTTTDQGKWSPLNSSEFLLKFGVIKDETGHTRENGDYKTSLQSLVMAHLDSRTLHRETRNFKAQAVKVTTLLSKPEKSLSTRIARLREEEQGGVRASELIKLVAGLASEDDKSKILENALSSLRSRRLRGAAYPAVLFAESIAGQQIQEKEVLVSENLYAKLMKHEGFTAVRLPVTSRQSYVYFSKENVHVLEGIPEGEDVIVLHPGIAGYVQGDNDDHMLVIPGYVSLFKAGCGEPVLVRADESKLHKLNVQEMDRLTLILYPWIAQARIGLVFNSMLRAIAAVKACGKSGDLVSRVYGSALDVLAQAVKKPYVLPNLGRLTEVSNSLVEKASKRKDLVRTLGHLSALCVVKRAKKVDEIRSRVRALWGYTLPELKTFEVETPSLSNYDRNIVKASIASARSVYEFNAARRWHAEVQAKCASLIIEGSRTISGALHQVANSTDPESYGDRVRMALETYASIAYNIQAIAGNENYALQTMDGVLIYTVHCSGD